MSTNLNSEYVKFVDEGGSLGHLAQEVIDRIQYTPGFLDNIKTLVNKTESPFETINTEEGQIRRIKQQFCT